MWRLSCSCSVVLFADPQYRSTYFSAWPSISQDQTNRTRVRFIPNKKLINYFSGDSWFEYFAVIINNTFVRFSFTLNASQIDLVKKWCWFSKVNQVWCWGFALFQPYLCQPRIQIRKDFCRRCTNNHSQFVIFPIEHSISFGSIKRCPQFSGIVELLFLDAPLLLFSALTCFCHSWPIFCQEWSSFHVDWIVVNRSPDHVYPSGCFSFTIVSCMKTKSKFRSILVNIDVPIISCTAFQQYIQSGICSLDHVNLSQWNWEWFFFEHTELNSWFNVVTINVILCDRQNSFRALLSSAVVSYVWDPSDSPCWSHWCSSLRAS